VFKKTHLDFGLLSPSKFTKSKAQYLVNLVLA